MLLSESQHNKAVLWLLHVLNMFLHKVNLYFVSRESVSKLALAKIGYASNWPINKACKNNNGY